MARLRLICRGVIVHEFLLLEELAVVLRRILDDSLLLSQRCASQGALDLRLGSVLQWLHTLQDSGDIMMEVLLRLFARRLPMRALGLGPETLGQLAHDTLLCRIALAADAPASTVVQHMSLRLRTDGDSAEIVPRWLLIKSL